MGNSSSAGDRGGETIMESLCSCHYCYGVRKGHEGEEEEKGSESEEVTGEPLTFKRGPSESKDEGSREKRDGGANLADLAREQERDRRELQEHQSKQRAAQRQVKRQVFKESAQSKLDLGVSGAGPRVSDSRAAGHDQRWSPSSDPLVRPDQLPEHMLQVQERSRYLVRALCSECIKALSTTTTSSRCSLFVMQARTIAEQLLSDGSERRDAIRSARASSISAAVLVQTLLTQTAVTVREEARRANREMVEHLKEMMNVPPSGEGVWGRNSFPHAMHAAVVDHLSLPSAEVLVDLSGAKWLASMDASLHQGLPCGDTDRPTPQRWADMMLDVVWRGHVRNLLRTWVEVCRTVFISGPSCPWTVGQPENLDAEWSGASLWNVEESRAFEILWGACSVHPDVAETLRRAGAVVLRGWDERCLEERDVLHQKLRRQWKKAGYDWGAGNVIPVGPLVRGKERTELVVARPVPYVRLTDAATEELDAQLGEDALSDRSDEEEEGSEDDAESTGTDPRDDDDDDDDDNVDAGGASAKG